MAKQKNPGSKITYVDRQDVDETFSDSFDQFSFDGSTLRCTFTVTRFETVKAPASPLEAPPMPNGKRYPVCRLVLTAAAAQQLYVNLSNLAVAIERSHKAQQAAGGTPTVQ